MIARLILLPQDRDVMIRPVHCRPHQVYGAGVHADVLFVNVLLVNSPDYKPAVRRQHKTPQFGIDGNIAHACRHKNLVENFLHAATDSCNINSLLVRTIRDSDSAGKIHECNMRTGSLVKLHCEREQSPSQSRIIVLRSRVAYEERMYAEMLYSESLQLAKCRDQLLFRATVFGVAGVVHDAVSELIDSAGVVPHANGLRNAALLFQKRNMRNIVNSFPPRRQGRVP